MTPLKYRRRPVIVEAVQFDGSNHAEIQKLPVEGDVDPNGSTWYYDEDSCDLTLPEPGDWIVWHEDSEESHVVSDADFRAAYEPVQEGEG